MQEKDNCQACFGESGGVPGNENRIDELVLCNYCHTRADAGMLKSPPPPRDFETSRAHNEVVWAGQEENAQSRIVGCVPKRRHRRNLVKLQQDPNFLMPSIDELDKNAKREVIWEQRLPDNTNVQLIVETMVGLRTRVVNVSLERDDSTSRKPNPHSIPMFRAVVKQLKSYAISAAPDYVIFGGKTGDKRVALYEKLVNKILRGTKFRLVDAWDDFYRIHSDVLDFLDMVACVDYEVYVIQKL